MQNQPPDRAEILRVLHEIWEANKDVDPAEVERIVEQAIGEVRAEKRRAAKRKGSIRKRRSKD